MILAYIFSWLSSVSQLFSSVSGVFSVVKCCWMDDLRLLQQCLRHWCLLVQGPQCVISAAELGQQIVAQALGGTGASPEQQSKFQECVRDALVGGDVGAPQLATQLLQGFLNTKG